MGRKRIESKPRVVLFLHRVADGFSALAEQRNWCRLDAQQSVSQLSQELEQILRESLQ
jgi:thymidylate kinase